MQKSKINEKKMHRPLWVGRSGKVVEKEIVTRPGGGLDGKNKRHWRSLSLFNSGVYRP